MSDGRAPALLPLAGSSDAQKQALWLQGLHGERWRCSQASTHGASVKIPQGPPPPGVVAVPGGLAWRLEQAGFQLPCGPLASVRGTGYTTVGDDAASEDKVHAP